MLDQRVIILLNTFSLQICACSVCILKCTVSAVGSFCVYIFVQFTLN